MKPADCEIIDCLGFETFHCTVAFGQQSSASNENPIERVWGVLEKHWNGQLLDSVEKVLRLSRTMSFNGKSPTVKRVKGVYKKGVKLTRKAMEKLETLLIRLPGIEKWAVDILCYEDK